MAGLQSGIAALRGYAIFARIVLFLFIAAVVLMLIPQIANLARQMRWADPPLEIFALAGLAGLFQLLVFAIAVLAICLWTWRAHANLRAGGVAELLHSPGWAVASFFVPVINFVVPMQAMRALHNRSHGGPPEWSEASVGSVASWWACHVAGVLLVGYTTFTTLLPFLSDVWITAPPAADTALFLLGQVLLGGSAWFLAAIIREVTGAQVSGTFAAGVFD